MGGRRISEGGEKSEQERLISIFGRKSGKIIDVHNKEWWSHKIPYDFVSVFPKSTFVYNCAQMYLGSDDLIVAALSFGFNRSGI